MNYTLPEETKVYVIIRGQAILQEIFVKNLSRRVAGQSDLVKYTKTFTYKDAKGQEIPLDKLLSTILNEQAFGGESVIKPSDVPEKKIKEFELRSPIGSTGQVLYELRRENSLIGENTISSSNYLNARMPRGQISAYLSQNTFTNKIPKVEIIDPDKALNGVSRDYHLVTYTEVQHKGKVTQKFVNEQGAEIRPSVTSEVKAVGEQITLTHPTDIDFENKRYTFKDQDKQDITEIVKGETNITYVYKQKYENNLSPVEIETPIPIETTYVADPTKEVGDNETVDNGTAGKVVTSTPKIVNELTGEVTDGQPTEKRTEMQPKVVKVGTKPTVVETTTPYTTRYVEDNTKDKDYREVTKSGKAGKTTTTTTYTLNPNTGTVISNEPTTITEEAVEEVITVGTKPTVVETTTPYTTRYVEDNVKDKDYREVTKSGKAGKTTTTTTYTLNPNTGIVTSNEPTMITEEAVEEVITVGTKPTVVETITPYTTRYVEDNTKDKDYREVTRPGKAGKTTTTTTYTLDPNTGAVTPNEPTTITEEAVEEVITVGTKPTVVETTTPYTTRYVEDNAKDKDYREVTKSGKAGKTTTTTTYTLNPNTGTVISNEPTTITEEAVEEVITVGTKPTVVETTTPYTTRYVEDNTKDKDYREVTRPGKSGKTTTTTTYTLNPNTGAVTSNEPTMITEEAVEEVITVGTKPKVVETTTPYTTRYVEDSTKDKDYREVTRPGKSGKTTTTTTYTLDPNTGAVTPNEPTTITEEAVEEVITVGTKPKVEAPKVETPKVETPKVETPKVETPKVETPKVETPKVETPKVEAPKVEAPKVEAPKVEAPKVEAPKIEVPKSKTPTEQSTKETSQIPTSVASKREELPNTGTEDHANLVVLGLLGVLSGFGFLAHKKKEVEK